MVYLTACNFVQKYGYRRLLWLLEQLNNGTAQAEIAKQLGLSPARVSQLCNKLFRVVYVFEDPVMDCLDFQRNAQQRDIDEIALGIEKHKKESDRLTFIRGRQTEDG